MNNEGNSRIAFIGGGNMARALIGGLLRQGVPARQLCVGEPQPVARESLEHELGVATAADNSAAIHDAALVVLAVKPQVAAQVLQSLHSPLLARRPVLLSIVAGLRIADLARLCPQALPIVRAMPNRPALVGAGITGLYAAPDVSAAQRSMAERIARAAGRMVWLRTEAELDIVTALSGSGPAYFFLLAEQLAAVTSKGGTTEAALKAFAAGGFGALVASALRAAAARSAELADSLAAAVSSTSSAQRS